MKTEEIQEYRKDIENRLISTDSMDAIKYYQGVLRALEWVIIGNEVQITHKVLSKLIPCLC